MKVKKGDNILVISGKDKGKAGKIIRAFPKDLKILVEGLNLRKKHVRPKKQGEKGQVVEVPAPINVSSVKLICPKCGKATRVGFKIVPPQRDSANGGKKAGTKQRACKKCGSII